METSPVQAGDIIAGKYEVERVLGEGGMGVVVAARHQDLDQRVAVKFLLPEIAKRKDAAERFRREARAAVRITSEHVARVLDVGSSDDGIPYMVMEYLQGDDLAHEIRARGQLPVLEAVTYVLQACEAVAEAHAAGIVHRDLKPANLFLAHRADGSRLVKVLDFGISKSTSPGSMADLALTTTSALIGSPLYMSPEQMHSAKTVDARTDIWSLGAILFQLLAGRPPYVAESIPQLCSALLHDEPPAMSTFRPDVPPELEAAIRGALTKDRNHRFASIADFAHALVPFAPESRVHAERANRVLAASDPNVSGSYPGATGPGLSKSSPSVVTGSHGVGHDATLASTPRPPGEKTLASWGKTGSENSEIAPRRMGRTIAVIGVGGVAAAVLIAWGVLRTTANATATQPPAETATTTPPAPPAPTPIATTPERTAEPTPPPPSASAEPTPAPLATTPPPRTVPTSKSHPAEKKKPTDSKLPDFGGRR